MLELDHLKRLTEELANEVHYEEHGKVWKMITMILEKLPLLALILDKDEKPIYHNDYTKNQYRKYHNKDLDKSVPMSEQIKFRTENPEIFPKTLATREIQETLFFSEASQINYKVISIPLIYNGVSGAIILMYDSTKCE